MARKTGKPQDHPLPEKDRKELLDELSSVQDMLSEEDAANPDEDPPVLEPDPDPADRGEEQMPLLQPESEGEDPANERLRQALSERPNPFLKDAARKTAQKSTTAPESGPSATRGETPAATSKTGEDQKAPAGASPAGTGEVNTDPGPALTEEQMRALVDETLAAWLPKIERELRDKLMERLRNG